MMMRHPAVHVDDSVPPAETTDEAFDEVWETLGWVRVEDKKPEAKTQSAPDEDDDDSPSRTTRRHQKEA